MADAHDGGPAEQLPRREVDRRLPERPEVLDAIAATATARRRELDESRSARTSVATMEPSTLVQRMRRFFGIHR